MNDPTKWKLKDSLVITDLSWVFEECINLNTYRMRANDSIWSKAKRVDIRWKSWGRGFGHEVHWAGLHLREKEHLSIICLDIVSPIIILVFVEGAWRVMWSVSGSLTGIIHRCKELHWLGIFMCRGALSTTKHIGVKKSWRKRMYLSFLLLLSKIFWKPSSSKQLIAHDSWLCGFTGLNCVVIAWNTHTHTHTAEYIHIYRWIYIEICI